MIRHYWERPAGVWQPQMRKVHYFLKNEEVILSNPGFFKDNLKTDWKSGYLYLTNLRLFFLHQSKNIFKTYLENIVGIRVQPKKFIQKRKDALCLSYLSLEREELSQIWIIVENMKTWKKKIFEKSLLQIDQETIERIFLKLDPESKAIVTYIWQNRYATIEELASLCNAPSHTEILLIIKETINPLAERMTGYPLLVFKKSKIDPETGKKILFSWWLIGRKKIRERRGPLLDLFDEGDYLRITLELFGVSEKNIQLKVNQDKLWVSTDSPDKHYQEEIPLPVLVHSQGLSKRYKNGILEVTLKKKGMLANKHGGENNKRGAKYI